MRAVLGELRPVLVLAAWTVRESLRRRVFVGVAALTAAFLALYALGCSVAFDRLDQIRDTGPVDARVLVGSTLGGLALFAILFLGSVLATFLSLSTVRGDAESGLLQPLVVRPVGRAQVLIARWCAAAAVSATYVTVVYVAVLLILHTVGGWRPDRLVGPNLRLALAVSAVAALCVLGSVVLTATANGITTFMVLGTGLFSGLLGQVGRGIGNQTLQDAAHTASWVLPFEALYQDALAQTTSEHGGLTRFLVQLGPFGGGSPAGSWLLPYVAGYLALVAAVAIVTTARRDL